MQFYCCRLFTFSKSTSRKKIYAAVSAQPAVFYNITKSHMDIILVEELLLWYIHKPASHVTT